MRPFGSHPDELISASLTGDLTDLERRELDSHLTSCVECRETLEAFTQQRQLLGQMHEAPAPRDLGPRVQAGIDSGRFFAPWWRRPGGLLAGVASLGVVAAAGLLAVFILNGGLNRPPVAASNTSTPSTVASVSPTVPASESVSPVPSATPQPLPLGMKPGDLIYLSLTGPKENRQLAFIRNATGDSVKLKNPSRFGWGQPSRALLSPDGRTLAFATLLDAKGTWIIFATDLAHNATTQLGETQPQAFGTRLLWSPDSRYLAFTVLLPEGGTSDVWLYDRQTAEARQMTNGVDAYASSWAPLGGGQETLWISLGAADPTSLAFHFSADAGIPHVDPLKNASAKANGVFMPLLSPDGSKAIYWRGSMKRAASTGWIFNTGGMPQLTGSASGGAPSWSSGAPLFSDLQPDQGGQAFASGDLTWAGDSDGYAFWGGNWNGTPEGPNYPDQNGVYAGRASAGGLSKGAALNLGRMTTPQGDQMGVVDVMLNTDGTVAAVTLVYPSPEFGAEAYLRTTPTSGAGKPTDVGSGGVTPPPWLGPGVYLAATASR